MRRGRSTAARGLGGGRWAHIDRSIATVPAHAHPQTSLAGTFLRRFFTAAGGVCHSLVLGCGAVGLFSINYFRKKKSVVGCRK